MTPLRGADSPQRPPRSVLALSLFGLLALSAAAGFMALGTWQLERRAWKLDLLERIATRIHAVPVSAPGPDQWPQVTRASDEYRRVSVKGHYLPGLDVRVRGVSELGAGYWLLTPLATTSGFTVLINRGFVTDDMARASGPTSIAPVPATLTGLLRMTEPKGRFLRANDPAAGHWYSRDVQAIAARYHMGVIAPYFIDLEASAEANAVPVTGLTVTDFPNNHLQYALTWFALGLMVLGAAGFVARYEWRLRQRA